MLIKSILERMIVNKWLVVQASLDPVIGSEQAKQRPVLVLSEDFINAAMNVITVAPFTTLKTGRQIYPNEALVPSATAGLSADSILLCHQIRAIDKQRLSKIYGMLTDRSLRRQIEEALKFHLGLS